MKILGSINVNKAVRNSVFSLGFAAISLATVLPTSAHAAYFPKNPPVEIKYVGSVDDKPVFQIRLDNTDGDELYLSLLDENGNQIYSDVVKDRKYLRNIQLDNLDASVLKVNLVLRSKKGYQTQSFQINKSVRMVENVEVTKVK